MQTILYFKFNLKQTTVAFCYYWRTKDKKEIDFILKIKKVVLSIEAKLSFEQFKPAAVNYFSEKYGIKKYKVVSLNGKPRSGFQVYPWEVTDEECGKGVELKSSLFPFSSIGC